MVMEQVDRWPGFFTVRNVYHRWGALHYLFAQTKTKVEHRRDVFSHCPSLLWPPFESHNLRHFEALIRRGRSRVLAEAGRRGALDRSAEWRHERAVKANAARWAKARASAAKRS